MTSQPSSENNPTGVGAEWIRYTGGDSYDYQSAQNAILNDGSIVLGVNEINGGVVTAQVVNYNPDGTEKWRTSLPIESGGTHHIPNISAVVSDSSDNIYANGFTKLAPSGRSGSNDTDPFVAKIGESGNLGWFKNYGDTLDEIPGYMGLDQDGNIWIAGRISNERGYISGGGYQGADFGGGWKGYEHEIAPDGSKLSTHTLGNWNSAAGNLSVDASNHVLFDGGYTFGSVNNAPYIGNGDPNGANSYLISRDTQTNQVNWTTMRNWITSNIDLDESGKKIYLVNKGSLEQLDYADGRVNWSVPFGANGGTVYVDNDGSIWAGLVTGNNEGTVKHFTASGENDWNYNFTTNGRMDWVNVRPAGDGDLYVAGSATGDISAMDVQGGFISPSAPTDENGFLLKLHTPFSTKSNGLWLDDQANTVEITGSGSGTADGTAFSNVQSVDLKGGNDTASIGASGSLAGLLNGGNGTDTLNLNTGANAFTINGSGTGTANGTGTGTANATSISSFEEVNLLGGDDTATIDLLNPATAARSLLLNGGAGNDVLDIKLSDQEFAELEDTDALLKLGAYLENPTGKTLDIAFGDFTLFASGFESATFNHTIELPDQPPAAPTLTTVAAFASDTTSASGLEGLSLDVGGAANVQAPVTLKSTSDASTVDGNVKADAHATDVLGISDSTLHGASDLSVGSALKSIVTGSAESTSGIAIANALVDTQHGIDLIDTNTLDALASGGSSTVISTSTLTATSTAQTVGDGSSDSGARKLDGAWANTVAEDHLGLGSTGTLTLDSESDATVTTSMVSNLSSTATANDGLAVATAQLLSSTGIENLNAEVGGLGLVAAINQGVFKADATSTTDDASAMSINKASAGILDSSFSFGITDSTITAKDLNSLQVSATSTGGDAWSKLQSSSTGIADLSGIENRITDAGSISAIASDQGFANSATVSGSSSAFVSQEAIGISGYDVHNHLDLILTAQALVISESNSSAVGG